MADWESVGTALGLGLAGFLAVFGARFGHKKSDGKPPPERPPAVDEVRAALAELRSDMGRLHAKHDRQAEIADDEWREVFRQLDRIEAAQRLESAMNGLRREQRP